MGNCLKRPKRVLNTPYQLRFDHPLASEFETPSLDLLGSGRYQKFTSSVGLLPTLTYTSATPISQLAEIDREFLTSINVVRGGQIPVQLVGLGEFLLSRIEEHPRNNEAFTIYGQKGLTYEELIRQTVTTSWIVKSLKCTQVLLVCSNSVQFAALSIALMLMKIPSAVINPKATDLYNIVDLVTIAPTAIFCTKDVANECQLLADKIKSVRDVVLIDCEEPIFKGQKTLSQFLKFPVPLELNSTDSTSNCPSTDLLSLTAFIVWTSGRRSEPKMVKISHYNIVSSLIALSHGPVTHGENCLGLIPLFHPFGLIFSLFNCLTTGCPITLLPKIEPSTLLTCIQQKKISLCIGVPPVLYFLLESRLEDSLKNLRIFINCAGPLTSTSVEKIAKLLPTLRLFNGYGLCEFSSISNYGLVLSSNEESNTCVGQVLPNMELKIVSVENDQVAVGPHSLGEICLRGLQLVQTTSRRLDENSYVDRHGWLRTGDLGYLDNANNLHITGLNNRRSSLGFQAQPIVSQSRVSGVRNMAMTPLTNRSARKSGSDKSGGKLRQLSAGSDSVFMA